MKEPIEIRSDDDILKQVKFTYYGYRDRRLAQQFRPKPDEPQTKDVQTSWGDVLTAQHGDYIVSDAANPNDTWMVERDIFEKSHKEEEPDSGIFKKVATVALVPLTEFTNGDPDQLVVVHSLEAAQTVRAGDFHLARGIRGEIWPFPSEKVEKNLHPL